MNRLRRVVTQYDTQTVELTLAINATFLAAALLLVWLAAFAAPSPSPTGIMAGVLGIATLAIALLKFGGVASGNHRLRQIATVLATALWVALPLSFLLIGNAKVVSLLFVTPLIASIWLGWRLRRVG